MSLLKQRDDIKCAADPTRRPRHFFNSFMLHKLVDAERQYIYSNVRRWTKKFDVFAADMLFFPVNLNNSHWTLAVVYVQLKKICYLDSMAGAGTKYLQTLMRWLSDEHRDKKGCDLPDVDAWELIPCKWETTPQQHNSVDCGAFTIMFADFLADDQDLMGFAQEDIRLFRRKIARFILEGKIDYPLL
jgi:Ulp1 family protease